jgi:hypothetical protein
MPKTKRMQNRGNIGRKEFIDLEDKFSLRGNECYGSNIRIK